MAFRDHPNQSFVNVLVRTLSVVLTLMCCARAMDATSADNLATGIISQLGRSKGVASIPNCGNGQLARAFLANSGMKVHAFDANQANVDATRQLLEPLGKIGPMCTIEKAPPTTMPYVSRFVDCIVITNLTDANLATLSYAEIERVLAPDGLAFIGRGTSEGSGITQAALQNWINAAGKTRSTAVVSTANGTWAVITGMELSGIDVWPRHTYDENNSNYSKDSVAGPPWLPQAKMKPYQQMKSADGSGGTTVTSGGRLYEVAPDIDTNNGIYGTGTKTLRAYSIYNGELLWSRIVTNDGLGNLKSDPIRAYGRDVYLMRSSGGILQLNGITGDSVAVVSSVPAYPLSALTRPTNGDNGCGPYHSSIRFNYNGNGAIRWDFQLNTEREYHYYKPPCGVTGIIISNGMTIYMRPTCSCAHGRYWGDHIEGSGGVFQYDRDAAADGSDRIEQGPAYGAVTAAVNPDSLDWPTHRSDIIRSGYSHAPVSTSASAVHLMWNRRPQFNYVTQRTTLLRDFRPEQEPTPPVAAGRYTFIGGSDGYLRCIDNTNGTVAWSYLTGGRIYATPTVWNGCVYAGSGDGYAYCIEAHTGRLVWRFRAAPVDMRMNLYGYLASAWPILTGVMVDANGNAYFAAGLQSEYGTHVYCVNAATGALKWQNNKSATVLNAVGRIGVVPCGYMTIAKNRLIIANSSAAAASFDLATGAYDTTSKRSLMTVMDKQSARYSNFVINGSVLDCATRGREIGVLDSTYFMTGGSAIFQDNALRTMVNFGGEQFIGFQTLNANGAPLYPLTRICETTIIAPMWDNQYYYHMLVGDERLEGYRISDFITALNARNPLPTDSLYFADSLYFGVTRYNTQIKNLTEVRPWFPTRLFSNTTLHFNATVLTPNAIVATFSTDKPGLQDITVPENTNWYVGALDRNTGSMLWQIALPDVATGLKGQPVMQGLAVDRNGNIIVTQYNGNVLCYGTGPVSVAGDEPVMPAVVPAPEPVASSAMWEAAGTARAQEASHGSAGQVAGPSVSPTPTEQFAMLRPLFFDEQTAGRDSARVVDASAACRRSPQMCGKSHAQEDGYAPRDMRWTPERSCLAVSAVRASSSVGKNTASNSIDHDLRTRWTPAAAGPQWTTYDLGNVQEIAAVSVVWYGQTSSRTAFSLETSLDGKAFSQVDAGHLAGRGTNTTLRSFVPQQARFVRLGLLPAQGSACPSIYEVGIHGGEARRAEAR